MSMRHFARLSDFTPEELDALARLGLELKSGRVAAKPLEGKGVGLCFLNPSLRTQTSFTMAAAALGGQPIALNFGANTWKMEAEDGAVMDGEAAEHLKDAVGALSSYCAVLGLRSFPEMKSWEADRKEAALSAFLKYAKVPVVNLESATGHPSQALADLMALKERMNPKGKKLVLAWAPHPKALPMAVPISTAEMAAMAGMNVTIARPEGYDLPPEVLARVDALCARSGASFTTTSDADAAYRGAHVVYAKSWGSLAGYGRAPDASLRAAWKVDARKMALTNDAFFMHCLPVRRNVVVDDAVIDGPSSLVQLQAENRLHSAKAILGLLAGAFSIQQTRELQNA